MVARSSDFQSANLGCINSKGLLTRQSYLFSQATGMDSTTDYDRSKQGVVVATTRDANGQPVMEITDKGSEQTIKSYFQGQVMNSCTTYMKASGGLGGLQGSGLVSPDGPNSPVPTSR